MALWGEEGVNRVGEVLGVVEEGGVEVGRMKTFSEDSALDLDCFSVGKEREGLLVHLSYSTSSSEGGDADWAGLEGAVRGLGVEVNIEGGEGDSCVKTVKNIRNKPFPSSSSTTSSSSLCLLKPHAIREGSMAAILNSISEGGFRMGRMETFHLSSVESREFFEVYRV